jgi:hypothetical protein
VEASAVFCGHPTQRTLRPVASHPSFLPVPQWNIDGRPGTFSGAARFFGTLGGGPVGSVGRNKNLFVPSPKNRRAVRRKKSPEPPAGDRAANRVVPITLHNRTNLLKICFISLQKLGPPPIFPSHPFGNLSENIAKPKNRVHTMRCGMNLAEALRRSLETGITPII